MYKSLPKSNISIRKFPVYKEWIITDNESPVIICPEETDLFNPDTSNFDSGSGLYTQPLYRSIQTKYYNARGNVFNQYGIMRNPAEWEWERYFDGEILVIKLPQLLYGEQIKKGSVRLTDLENPISGSNIVYTDDSFGNIQSGLPTYRYTGFDPETQIMTFEDLTQEYEVVCTNFDANTGVAVFTLEWNTENYYVAVIDHETNILLLDRPLIFDDTVIGELYNGNVFYDDGLIVLTNVTSFTNYELEYNSVQTIHETEVMVNINQGEFNVSQNPTAVNVLLENEYDWETTKITNSEPAGTVHIKEIQSISQIPKYYGTVGNATGSWDDYFTEASTDPTGSYLTPFISTIGLYDADNNMIAVAKLPKPIKKLPNYDLNFLIRFDT